MPVCNLCNQEIREGEVEVLTNGRFRCLECEEAWLTRFFNFSSFWLRHKVQSEDGKTLNQKIVNDVNEKLNNVRHKRKLLQELRAGGDGTKSGRKEKNYRVDPRSVHKQR